MAGGLNVTGLPDTGDYSLGRGVIYIAEIDTTTGKPNDAGWEDLGNAPEFSTSVDVETLEHVSSRGGLAVTDKEVVLSQTLNIAFTLDELRFQNIARFLSGDSVSEPDVNPAVAGFGPIVQTSVAGITALGRWYDITDGVNQTGVRVMDIDATLLTVNETSGAPVLLTEDVDYTVDEKTGRIFFLTTAADITAGEPFSVTLSADAAAVAYDEVRGLTKTSVLVALKFVAVNPANNDEVKEYQFHQVNLKAEGDFSLIGQEFTTMGFTAVAESNALADPNSPIVTIRTTGQ